MGIIQSVLGFNLGSRFHFGWPSYRMTTISIMGALFVPNCCDVMTFQGPTLYYTAVMYWLSVGP